MQLFKGKNIKVITGRRADYGIYLPVLKAIREHPCLRLRLEPVCPPEVWDSYLGVPIDRAFPIGQEDCVVVLGDTILMLMEAIRASERNIPVAHIHGGDKTGSIDDKIRPAISCFADFHFPSLPAHAERLKQMDFSADRIKVVGPLGIYAMKDAEFVPESKLRENLNLSCKPIILVIQHPVTGEANEEHMCLTLAAVSHFSNCEIVVIYPNSEVDSQKMVDIIKVYPFKSFVNLPYLTFLSLLKYSSVIVGNSSCALVEAPLFGTRSVNIGTRQNGRESMGNLLNVDEDINKIMEAIKISLQRGRWGGVNYYANIANCYDGASIIANTLAEGI